MRGTPRALSAGLIAAVMLVCSCLADDHPPNEAHADKVPVLKKERTLTLLVHGKVLKKYKVALGRNPVGPKIQAGDHKTPEGLYVLDRRNEHRHFYRSLHISYPNAEDRERTQNLGTAPGGDIMIHGLPNGFGWLGSTHRLRDWTDGCVAVTNEEMDEIWRMVPDGTPIEIDP
jgi:murein L,D-transpeptidase YafK